MPASYRRLFLPLFFLLLAACGSRPSENAAPQDQASYPEAEVIFRVEIPEDTPPGEAVQLTLLDEVTGLAFNPQRTSMQVVDSLHYSLSMRAPIGAVIKYRYTRLGAGQTEEFTSEGQPVRYRLYFVDGPGTVEDIVSRWSDTPAASETGRLIGEVVEAESGVPIPNLLVAAGGVQALTASDGSLFLPGLPPGKHTVVGYALDGSYRPFKQEAIIAQDAATPVSLRLQRAPSVNVTFTVSVPPDTVPTVPLRLVGNLLQLGNTFASLNGGTSVLSNRAPVMQPLPDGRYFVTLALPAGADVRYKYSLGDGLWNAEHAAGGGFRLRRLIVPQGVDSYAVEDNVGAWQSGAANPIWFDAKAPSNTPNADEVYIQFNLFGWMEPVPMWPAQENRWGYRLSGPTNVAGGLEYRFCRNAQCGGSEGIAVEALEPPRMAATDVDDTQTLQATIEAWRWWGQRSGSTTVLPNAVQRRGEDFIAGVEFLPAYHPSWDAFIPNSLGEVKALSANWVSLSPTWSFTNADLPLLAQTPGQDILWPDLAAAIESARNQGLRVGLYPQPNFPQPPDHWWGAARRDFGWWHNWFERYHAFILHHADLAERRDVEALILGGDWLLPALPGGSLADGASSNVPADAESRWRALIADLRVHYSGKLVWALSYPEGVEQPPAFLDQFDEIYLLLDAPLAQSAGAPESAMEVEAGRLLDEEVLPLQLELDMPFILAVAYPSADGGATGCLPSPEGGCLSHGSLAPTAPDLSSIQLDLAEQVDVYNALLAVVNERPWVSGFVSRGYYPPVALEDKSASVHGKPAAEVLWFWYSGLLGSQ